MKKASTASSKASTTWNYSDQPITSGAKDLLRRSPYAKAVAQSLINWRSHESLVVALYGGWGEGKTSFKNFILEALRSQDPDYQIVDFNPWQWSSTSSLTDAFFDEVAIALGKTSRKERGELTKTFRRYAARLKSSSALASDVGKLLQAAAMLTLCFCLIGIVLPSRVLFISMLLLNAVSQIFGWLSNSIEHGAGIVALGDEANLPSLEALKDSVRNSLIREGTRLLVVIDDLDRLSPRDLTDMVRLVKANGDLPNVTYLLLGERKILASHISSELHVDGDSYLDKIVQIPLDVPIPGVDIHTVLFAELDRIILSSTISDRFDPNYWREIYNDGLKPYFINLRQIYRFLSTLEFHTDLLRGTRVLEVDPVDLIAIEALRTFEPDLYELLPGQKAFLTASMSFLGSDHTLWDQQGALFASKVSTGNWPRVQALLRRMFPYVAKAFGGANLSGQSRQFIRSGRITSVEHFDRYFAFHVADTELSDSEMDDLGICFQQGNVLQALEQLRLNGKLKEAIFRLESYVDDLKISDPDKAAAALFTIAENLEPTQGMFTPSPMASAERIVEAIIGKAIEPANAFNAALLQTDAVTLPLYCVLRFEQRQKKGDLHFALDNPTYANAQKIIVDLIRNAFRVGRLFQLSEPGMALRLWQEWGRPGEVQQAVKQMLNNVSLLTSFLASQVRQTESSVPDKNGNYFRRYIKLGDIERFISPEEVMMYISKIDTVALSGPAQESVGAFFKAVKRRAEGKADYGFPDYDED